MALAADRKRGLCGDERVISPSDAIAMLWQCCKDYKTLDGLSIGKEGAFALASGAVGEGEWYARLVWQLLYMVRT